MKKFQNSFFRLFVQTNTDLSNYDRVDNTFSGITCSNLLYSPTRLNSANVEDPRYVLCKFDWKNWTAKNITRAHKPNDPDEIKLIEENGGRVESYKDDDE